MKAIFLNESKQKYYSSPDITLKTWKLFISYQ